VILDTSAVVALVLKEPGFELLLEKLGGAPSVAIGAPTLTETAIVLSARLRQDARGLLSRFLVEGSISTVPFGEAHFSLAVGAWLQYGKGRHPAALNFGDCMSYATAKLAEEPLLYVGDDFTKTDLELA
jgi:ribonuclease VapC